MSRSPSTAFRIRNSRSPRFEPMPTKTRFIRASWGGRRAASSALPLDFDLGHPAEAGDRDVELPEAHANPRSLELLEQGQRQLLGQGLDQLAARHLDLRPHHPADLL